MSETVTIPPVREETPVDDVRRVRVRLSREAGGSVRRLIEESRRHAQRYMEELGLKPAAPARDESGRSGSAGCASRK
jgi:hypothetical protein